MKKIISPVLLALAAIIWGIAFVAQKAATVVSPFTLLVARSAIATFVLFFIVILFDKLRGGERALISRGGSERIRIDISKREIIGGIICGAFLFIASALQQAGIGSTDAGKTSFITALYVVIVPIYGLALRKRSPINAWIGVIIAVIGFYLLCIKEDFSIAPSDLLVFACAFVFAMQIMAIDAFSDCDGIRLSFVQFATVTLLSIVCAVIFESGDDLRAIKTVIPEILFLGIGSSGIAYTLQILGQKNSVPAVASIILSLESVFGAFFSAIILAERMSAREYVGCAVVLLAVLISQIDFAALLNEKNIKKY